MNTVTSVTSKNRQYEIGDSKARNEKLNIKDLPKMLSFFQNDTGFIDRTVSNLVNYYAKSETYSKDEIQNLLTARLMIQIVDELPTTEISTSTIYFLKRTSEKQEQTQEQFDVYDEYIYVDATWELIGNTYVDLSDYYKKSEADSMAQNKVDTETNQRISSENILQNNIDEVQNNLDTTDSKLDSEILSRQQSDLTFTTEISEIKQNISTETSRATNAENILSDRVDVTENHIVNTSNPHNVTAEQIGLGNVTNVSTTNTITKDSQENITSGAVYSELANKVDKIDGYGLSQENFTYAEKTKLSGLNNYDDTDVKSRLSETESAINILNGDSTVDGSVDKKIVDAIGDVTQIDFQIVEQLPESGKKGVIYFVLSDSLSTSNEYNEYVWINNAFELLGKTSNNIDLSDYYKKTETNALVSVKNDKITITSNSTALTDTDTFISGVASNNPTEMKTSPLNLIWNYMRNKIISNIHLEDLTYGEISS